MKCIYILKKQKQKSKTCPGMSKDGSKQNITLQLAGEKVTAMSDFDKYPANQCGHGRVIQIN